MRELLILVLGLGLGASLGVFVVSLWARYALKPLRRDIHEIVDRNESGID